MTNRKHIIIITDSGSVRVNRQAGLISYVMQVILNLHVAETCNMNLYIKYTNTSYIYPSWDSQPGLQLLGILF
jgi:hypothetical protein